MAELHPARQGEQNPCLRWNYIHHRPEVTLCREFEKHYAAFRHAHRHNPELLSTVDLLEAQIVQEEVDGDCRFLLGLRMGLDLGGLDVMEDSL